VAGLLFGARGLYRADPATLPTFLGQDAITLVVILPLLLCSMWDTRSTRLNNDQFWEFIQADCEQVGGSHAPYQTRSPCIRHDVTITYLADEPTFLRPVAFPRATDGVGTAGD
jgi:hypothetical protein